MTIMQHQIPPIQWVPLDYRRLQHLVTEINALVLRCKNDPSYRHDFAATHSSSLSKRAKQLTAFAHRAKQEERSEYVLIAKQVMRFRQLRNSCENELARGHEWQQERDHDAQGSPQSPPTPLTSNNLPSKNSSSETKSQTKSNGNQVVNTTLGRSRPGQTTEWKPNKTRRNSVTAAKNRMNDPIAMIRNRLRGAAYHMGKMKFEKLFAYYDRDNSGLIDKSEFLSIVRRDGKITTHVMSNQLLSNLFDKELDVNGDGDLSHSEFVEWIMKDYIDPKKRKTVVHQDDQKQELNTFERLYLSAPKYTKQIQKDHHPSQRRKSLNSPESGGDFRAILRGGYNADTAKAWRQNYHTKVDTKAAKYPVLYAWEKKGQTDLMQFMGGGGSKDEQRKFSSPVTESAKKAHTTHYMGNINSLRKESKKLNFKNEKLQLAFGRRIPQKIEESNDKSPKRPSKREKPVRDVVSFQIVMNEDEFSLYKRLILAIPLQQDHYQAKAAKDAAETAIRRLSMYDYGQDTIGMWGGSPSVRTNPENTSNNNLTNANEGAATTNHNNPQRPFAVEWSEIASPASISKDTLAMSTTENGTNLSDAAAQEALDKRINQYTADGNFDKYKAAAFAAGQAHTDTERRGSQINLVNKNKQQTTSLLFRRPSSEQRELQQAQNLFEQNRKLHSDQQQQQLANEN